MNIEFLQLRKYLEVNQPPVWAVIGDDSYLVDSAIKQITESLNIEYADLNITNLHGTVEAGKVTEACLVVPFMSGRRLVSVKEYPAPKAESEKQKLRDYFFKPNETTCLVINFTEKTAAAEYKLETVNCDKLNTATLTDWVTKAAAKSKRSISWENAGLIVAYCLEKMGRISKEVQKLCVYCENEITKEAIGLLVEKESDFVVYALAEEIARKNPDKAMECAKSLLDKGEETVALVGSIYSLFRRMFYSSVSSASLKELAAMLSVKEFAVSKSRILAESFTPVQLKNALELCRKADEELKTFNSDKLTVFYGLILGLLHL